MRIQIALSLLCAVACSDDGDRGRFDISQDPSSTLDDGGDPRRVPARSPDSGPGNGLGDTTIRDGLDASARLDATADANPSAPDSATPFRCQTANDCAILNVGSCCGYFPRCANSGAVFTQPDCSGVVSTCGFPAIDSCGCEQGQCVSLQAGVRIDYP
ncbi:MAG TPA: hypothetical protein VFX59_29705 [Polyangiales bacterium]|nr:hypothetical protein [Polyangiales bacterium]